MHWCTQQKCCCACASWHTSEPAEIRYRQWSGHRMQHHLPGCAAACCTPSDADEPHSYAQAYDLLLLLLSLQPPQQHPANKLYLLCPRFYNAKTRSPCMTTYQSRVSCMCAKVRHSQACVPHIKCTWCRVTCADATYIDSYGQSQIICCNVTPVMHG